MTAYLFCFWLGFSGFIVMVLFGSVRGHGRASHQHHHGGGKGGGSLLHGSAGSRLLSLVSPRVIFGALLGGGATGVLVEPWLGDLLQATAALLGGWTFEYWLVRPFWTFLFGFASAPARMLASAVLEEAEAVTNFDADGRGLVSFELDGQVRQMLARLPREALSTGVRIRSGDRLFITAVDEKRSACTVSPRSQ